MDPNLAQKRIKRQDGFTLIEIIAVLLIFGILFLVAVPKFFDFQKTATDMAIQSAVTDLNSQVWASFANHIVKGKEAGGYTGYNGDLGKDFIITGQGPDLPATGTIKMVKTAITYELIWDPEETNNMPGHFSLGVRI